MKTRALQFCLLTSLPLGLWLTAARLAPAAEGPVPLEMDTYLQGRSVFESQCSPCHGRSGRGDGEWAAGVTIKPRNFRKGIFKFRTTPIGFLPTTADLVRTIRGGVSGTMMPSFVKLSDDEVKAVIAYVRGFSRRWDKAENYADPVAIPEAPDWMTGDGMAAHAAKGGTLFQQVCAVCHGPRGKGDGPGGKALIDVWENPVKPADLSVAHHRSGDSPRDLYRTIAMGLDGTPMLGFREAMKPDQIWDLIAYIRTLQGRE